MQKWKYRIESPLCYSLECYLMIICLMQENKDTEQATEFVGEVTGRFEIVLNHSVHGYKIIINK